MLLKQLKAISNFISLSLKSQQQQQQIREKFHSSSFRAVTNVAELLPKLKSVQQNLPGSLRDRQNLQLIRYSSASTTKRRSNLVSRTVLDDIFKMEWPKITLFGDSITRRSVDPDNGCWGSMIAYQVGNYFNLDVRGFEGYNTEWALDLMPQLFPGSYLEKVELFIPFFGHNDSWDASFPSHVPLDRFESNLNSIIKYLVNSGLKTNKIIMITPTWYHANSFEKYMKDLGFPPTNKQLDSAKSYSETVLRVGREHNIDVVDFFAISAKQEPLKDMFCDGVHLSRSGAKLLFDALSPVIAKKVELSFKKPLADLWHCTPFDQRPEVRPAIEKYLKAVGGSK